MYASPPNSQKSDVVSRDTDAWSGQLDASTLLAARAMRLIGARPLPGLTVLAHPDPSRVGSRVVFTGFRSGSWVELSRLTPTFTHPSGASSGRALHDPYLSRAPLQFGPGAEPGALRLFCGDTPTVVEANGNGVVRERTFTAGEIEAGVVLLLAHRVALLLSPPVAVAAGPRERQGLVGDGPAMSKLHEEIGRVAELAVPVLIQGETGTDKELVAQALHRAGPRPDRASLWERAARDRALPDPRRPLPGVHRTHQSGVRSDPHGTARPRRNEPSSCIAAGAP